MDSEKNLFFSLFVVKIPVNIGTYAVEECLRCSAGDGCAAPRHFILIARGRSNRCHLTWNNIYYIHPFEAYFGAVKLK